MRLLNWPFALVPALLFGQTQWNTVTVNASREVNQPLDQAVFQVTLQAGSDQGLDDVVSVLAGCGITAADLIGIASPYGTNAPIGAIDWTFQLIVPLSKVNETIATLSSLQQNLAQKRPAQSLSFLLESVQSSGRQAVSCDFAALISDARAQAQGLAGTAGFTPGAIVAIANSVAQGISSCSLTARFALGTTLIPSGPKAISITASRAPNSPYDHVLIRVTVNSGLTFGLDDITSVLASAGIAGATFTGVSVVNDTQHLPSKPSLAWALNLNTPVAKLQQTLAQLAASQTAVHAQNPSLSLSFSIQNVQSPVQASCAQADLLADARAQAQKIASAAGGQLGGVLSLSNGSVADGDFSAIGYAGNVFPAFRLVVGYDCSLTAQFQLL